ncbi:MAG: hypothetical protein V8S97_02715 [Oscillospiraceae bacterium]
MLAIKNILAEKDQIDTLIFDEIDTGVSGGAAQKIGQKLKETAAAAPNHLRHPLGQLGRLRGQPLC